MLGIWTNMSDILLQLHVGQAVHAPFADSGVEAVPSEGRLHLKSELGSPAPGGLHQEGLCYSFETQIRDLGL